MKARFSGQVFIDESKMPSACGLTGEGSGGVAGFAKGSALIRVQPSDGGSRLSYEAVVDIGGKLASLGDGCSGVSWSAISTAFSTRFGRFARRKPPKWEHSRSPAFLASSRVFT